MTARWGRSSWSSQHSSRGALKSRRNGNKTSHLPEGSSLLHQLFVKPWGGVRRTRFQKFCLRRKPTPPQSMMVCSLREVEWSPRDPMWWLLSENRPNLARTRAVIARLGTTGSEAYAGVGTAGDLSSGCEKTTAKSWLQGCSAAINRTVV